MGLGYKRSDLQAHAQRKLDDAIILFRAGSYSNAYYMAGYTVELGLKACVPAQIVAYTVPEKDLLKGFLDHNLPKLVGLAGLASELKRAQNDDVEFSANWALVCEWGPDARYEHWDATSAQTIINAISDGKSGVFQWIKKHW